LAQFTDWFGGLWHGKALGSTLAVITLFVCLILMLIAHNLPSDSE